MKAALISSALLLAACSTDSHKALFPIELQPQALSETGPSWTEQAQNLEKLLKDDESLRFAVADIEHVLQAEIAEEQGQWGKASQEWLAALEIDRGTVGKAAFNRWTTVQAKVDAKVGSSPEALARLLLTATKNGSESPWLKKQNLTTQAALAKRIQTVLGQKPVSEPQPVILPSPDSFPGEDEVLWTARIKAVCKKSLDARWVAWVQKLSDAQKIYWNGLLANCDGESGKAAVFFKQSLAQLSESPEDKARAVRSAELLVSNLKAVGDRVGATDAYEAQSHLLKQKNLPLALLKWTPFDQHKRAIESLFWVARNRAMQGDYERATAAAEDGLAGINQMTTLASGPKEIQVASDLKVEGYQVLASRIAYEQLDFEKALSLNKMALESPGLTPEWRQRLLWADGWYHYRKGDKEAAIKAWDVFLNEKLEDSLRTKALFWKGRTFWELGRKTEADEAFEAVAKLAPLSFYAVVAIPNIDPAKEWTENFKKADAKRLSKIDDFDWGAYKEEAEAMKRFHRLEIALHLKLKGFYEGLGLELFEQINGKPKLIKDVEPTLYATRLLHMAHQYILSISLSASMSQSLPGIWHDYPEQLLIFFPTPFRADVERFATQTSLEPQLIWGLSRQESSFRPAVESPAGAIGLMQLMPATAQEVARSQGLSASGISERLKQPELNLQLGSLYLAKLGKRYQNKWPRAIAAYNAGEYVVDTWMIRRDDPDMIIWSEALSFGETSSYVKNVWRNWEVYRWLSKAR